METNNNIMIRLFFILVGCLICSCFSTDKEHNIIRIVLQTKPKYSAEIRKALEAYNFNYHGKINDKLLIFDKNIGGEKLRRLHIDELKVLRQSNNHIEKLDQSMLFYPESPITAQAVAYENDPEENNRLYVCPPFFDDALGIDQAWSLKNVTGKGVVIGVTDVGIDTENIHLKQNIDQALSYNFVDDHSKTNPIQVWEIIESKRLTSHGNACAGLIAGAKTKQRCDMCGVGVAYNSKVADLQIAKINKKFWQYPQFDTALYAAALAHKPDNIHIYSNSWGVTKPFHTPMFWEDEVLTEGMNNGRRGLGSVYVFPAGLSGTAFSNHIATITVACLGLNGTVHAVSEVNSAALVSVFCNGRSRSDTRMITVGHESDSCLTEFGGESAGAAIVSGMIGLLLEANVALSSRDVKHILVMSSRHVGLMASSEFVENGAGYFYHAKLGFGYPNATLMVSIGSKWEPLPPLCRRILELTSKHALHMHKAEWYERMYYVDTYCDSKPCIEVMEDVIFDVKFTYPEHNNMKLWATSPNGTVSVLAVTENTKNAENVRPIHTRFRINHFWGENSEGLWRIHIACNISKEDEDSFYECNIAQGKLVIYGVVQKGKVGYHCQDDPSVLITKLRLQSSTAVYNTTLHTVPPSTSHTKHVGHLGAGLIIVIVVIVGLAVCVCFLCNMWMVFRVIKHYKLCCVHNTMTIITEAHDNQALVTQEQEAARAR